MSFPSRLFRVVRANANAMVGGAEDPVKILDQALLDMQREVASLRQAEAGAVASQKTLEARRQQASDLAAHWYDRACTALQQGNEVLAREALAQCKPYEDAAQALGLQLKSQTGQVENLKRNLLDLEGRLVQAQAKRSTLKARIQSVQARKHLQGGASAINTDSAMDAVERMEEKVEAMEAGTATVGHFGHFGSPLSEDWESLDLEGRFQEMKARLHSGK